ncbi:MAG: hypothetical protein V3T11_09955 [Roseateles sp.]
MTQARIKHVADVATNMPFADFWLQRRGSDQTVGRVERDTFNVVAGRIEDIGIRVIRTDIVDARYLSYWFENLWNQGYWRSHNHGTLRLRHITVSDVKNLKI